MKNLLKKIFKIFYPILISLLNFETRIATKWVNSSYKRLFNWTWGYSFLSLPENFDHTMDLYWQWPLKRNPHWLERGIFNIQALKMFENPIVLELCCGDGFNAKYFYSTSCKEIYSCDFDKAVINLAKRKNSSPNIFFSLADIRSNMPTHENGFNNIIWDAAIEHFTESEIESIMINIKSRLAVNGILSGHTICEKAEGKSLPQHEYEFKDMNDLKRFFEPWFKNVYVFETIYDDRHNFYFYASDGDLPFSKTWEHYVEK